LDSQECVIADDFKAYNTGNFNAKNIKIAAGFFETYMSCQDGVKKAISNYI